MSIEQKAPEVQENESDKEADAGSMLGKLEDAIEGMGNTMDAEWVKFQEAFQDHIGEKRG